MKKTMESVMIPNVHTVAPNVTLHTAEEIMKKHNIRHLPVQRAGRIVGVISDRDLKLAGKFPGSREFPVEEVMTADPFVAAREDLFSDVAATMAERKYGCVVVVDRDRPVGIFTAVDGLRLLAAAYR